MHGTYCCVCVALKNVLLILQRNEDVLSVVPKAILARYITIRQKELWKGSEEMRVSGALGLQPGTLNKRL